MLITYTNYGYIQNLGYSIPANYGSILTMVNLYPDYGPVVTMVNIYLNYGNF